MMEKMRCLAGVALRRGAACCPLIWLLVHCALGNLVSRMQTPLVSLSLVEACPLAFCALRGS